MTEKISDIGEFGLIGRLRDLLLKEGHAGRGVVVGIGDDTASFIPRAGHETLITCDSMVEGRHYLPECISPHDLGRRAMICNISDIGAMGGLPLYALVSLGLRPETAVVDVEEMYRGFLFELNPFHASIIGGNITGVGGSSFIDITLLGEVPEGKTIRRSTAKPGDAILVTGFPGRSGAGLRLLLEKRGEEGVENRSLVRKYLVPGHRAGAGRAVALSGLATAMIDTSDGFLGDLGHICEESGAGADLEKKNLPLDEDLIETARRFGEDPLDFVLGNSDDYELIITCPPEHVIEVIEVLREAGVDSISEVGKITSSARTIRLIDERGGERRIHPKGWDHFGK
ncbi:MAG: thiamine-phosphate kinase [Desulfobacteraceae bacterium]|nr:MAG: thiamine-phosphate kinase [Desulfobacteraceae bacterium]